MKTIEQINAELIQFCHIHFKIPVDVLKNDPSFDEMNLDSLTKLEILFHADEAHGSNVLDYLEDGLIDGNPPSRLSELAKLIPKCLIPVKEFLLERKIAATQQSLISVQSHSNEI